MPRTRKLGAIVLAAVVVAVAAGAGGCGGSSAEIVAEVNGAAITKPTLEHWLHILAVRSYQLHPLTPVPAGVVPDPPRYANCIAYLKTLGTAKRFAEPFLNVEKPLRTRCKEQYEQLRAQALRSLITADWLIGEGKARGLVASEAAIRKYAEKMRKNGYTTRAEFTTSLANAGETLADQLFRAKVKVFSEEIEKQFGATSVASTNDPALGRFLLALPARWAAKTSCRSGYVVPNCKQYKGKYPPEYVLM
ncbi:MAG TPA: hypothetical protein VK707_08565 [Solirubrobacteraceae bacterium]|jgi:hypothetical protein|nr:hypothetical protein [Solirubrobacteraceae bacterium]